MVRRLVGWTRVALRAGESRQVSVSVDPRLLAHYDVGAHGWHVSAGRYRVSLRPDALADGPGLEIDMPEARWPAAHGTCGGVPCAEDRAGR